MGILLGLTAAVLWGICDYLIAIISRAVGTTRAMALSQIISLVGWLALLLVFPSHPVTSVNLWAITFGAAACYVAGMWLSYRAFEIGTLSILSPIASSFIIITALLEALNGHIPPIPTLIGGALLFGGIVLITRAPGHEGENPRAGVPHAVVAALGFGVMFWLLDYVTPAAVLGPVWPIITLKVLATTLTGGTLWMDKLRGVAAPLENIAVAVRAAIGFAVLDLIAWLAFIWGTRTEFTTTVTALASLFSAVAMVLGWVLLRERPAIIQRVGVGVIFAGILLISFVH